MSERALTVVIAPSGFKESLSAEEVADAIAEGVRAADPRVRIIRVPLVDGGEGFTRALINATDGVIKHRTVTGPVGQPVESHFGILGGDGPKTAVIEMAAAAGLRLVPRDKRNPLLTTTYGVGELIRAALDEGVERILIGCGDSGTSDGGAGMAQALGARLLRADGSEIGRGCGALALLEKIDLSGLDPRLKRVKIDVACNIHNVLTGANGVARVFGPQKGATPGMVEQMEMALMRYARIIWRDLRVCVKRMPGGGASGGLGAGLHALLGATLHPRYEIVMQYLELDRHLREADLVITAEGGLDFQTPRGKIPAEVAARARRYGVPVIAVAGTVGQDARVNYEHGIAAYTSVLQRPCTLDEAFQRAYEWVAMSSENIMRMIGVGWMMRAVARA
ncbi:MAG: glycerate kinase [Anaerolineae bacterium]|nr:glycerate kinase [Anaerolineae bacterium]